MLIEGPELAEFRGLRGNGDLAQRRRHRVGVGHGCDVEGTVVAGTHDDDRAELPSLELLVPAGGDLARELVSGMGANQRAKPLQAAGLGLGQHLIDLLGEFRLVAGVKPPGDCRPHDPFRLLLRSVGRQSPVAAGYDEEKCYGKCGSDNAIHVRTLKEGVSLVLGLRGQTTSPL